MVEEYSDRFSLNTMLGTVEAIASEQEAIAFFNDYVEFMAFDPNHKFHENPIDVVRSNLNYLFDGGSYLPEVYKLFLRSGVLTD